MPFPTCPQVHEWPHHCATLTWGMDEDGQTLTVSAFGISPLKCAGYLEGREGAEKKKGVIGGLFGGLLGRKEDVVPRKPPSAALSAA